MATGAYGNCTVAISERKISNHILPVKKTGSKMELSLKKEVVQKNE
jgi:hypothetical protein